MFPLIISSASLYACVKSFIACSNAVLSAFVFIVSVKSFTALSRFACTLSIAACNLLSASLYAFSNLDTSLASFSLNALRFPLITVSASSYAFFAAASFFSISVLLALIVSVKSFTALSRFACTCLMPAQIASSASLYAFSSLDTSLASFSLNALMFPLIISSASLYACVKSFIACSNAVLSAFVFIVSVKSFTALSRFACTLSIAACNLSSAALYASSNLDTSLASFSLNLPKFPLITASASSYAFFASASLPSISVLLSPIVLVKSLTALSRFACT